MMVARFEWSIDEKNRLLPDGESRFLFVSGAIGGPERGWESHCRNGGRTTWAQSKKHPQPDWLRVSVQLSKCDGLVHAAHVKTWKLLR